MPKIPPRPNPATPDMADLAKHDSISAWTCSRRTPCQSSTSSSSSRSTEAYPLDVGSVMSIPFGALPPPPGRPVPGKFMPGRKHVWRKIRSGGKRKFSLCSSQFAVRSSRCLAGLSGLRRPLAGGHFLHELILPPFTAFTMATPTSPLLGSSRRRHHYTRMPVHRLEEYCRISHYPGRPLTTFQHLLMHGVTRVGYFIATRYTIEST